MEEGMEKKPNMRTIIIVAGIVLAIIIFFLTYWLFTSGKEEDHKIEFYLNLENEDPDHIYFMEWEEQTYTFEEDKDFFKFDIDHEQTYSFTFQLKKLASDENFKLTGTVEVSGDEGLVLEIIENDMGEYSIYTDMKDGKVSQQMITFRDIDYVVEFNITEYSV